MSHHNSRFDVLGLNFSPTPLVSYRYLPILRIACIWVLLGFAVNRTHCELLMQYQNRKIFQESWTGPGFVPLCDVVTSFCIPLQDLSWQSQSNLGLGSFIESMCCEDLFNQKWLQQLETPISLHSTFTPRYSYTSPSSAISNLAAIPFMVDSIWVESLPAICSHLYRWTSWSQSFL